MDRPQWVPEDVDPTVANIGRIYDALLGGAHNFAVDRDAAAALLAADDNAALYAQLNRSFLRLAIRAALDAGVCQFLDLGSGIPTVGNTHEVAQAIDSSASVCYVDRDPVAVAHSQAILNDVPNAVAVRADIRDPDSIFNDPVVAGLLDFGRPVAVLLVAVLHFIPDAADPVGIIRRIRDRVASGSYLVASHLSFAAAGADTREAEAVTDYEKRTGAPLVSRSMAEVTALFDAWGELVDPGIVRVPFWRPEPGSLEVADRRVLEAVPGLAGVARRP